MGRRDLRAAWRRIKENRGKILWKPFGCKQKLVIDKYPENPAFGAKVNKLQPFAQIRGVLHKINDYLEFSL